MILTLLQRTKAEDDLDFSAVQGMKAPRRRMLPLTHAALSDSEPSLSLTRSEEFLNGTHDIFDILVLQSTHPLSKGDKQAP